MGQGRQKLINEAELFAGLAKGDERCFEAVYHHYSARLFPYVDKMVRSKALTEEIIQDIFVQLWINRHLLLDVKFPTSYLFNIAANKTLSYLKKIANTHKLVDKMAMGQATYSNDTEEQLMVKESKRVIEMAVAQLPEQRRLIWELSRNQGLSHKQIAAHLGISTSTVNNQLGHAMQFLRKSLENRADILSLSIIILLTDSKL
ncbi:RNA polymerase ECF-type sigma factor [Pedobacter sp. BAL39]|uniref:RNA polymerase sigma-70 factor n=1 Tax=Pedobacter sp. BAL39 TaxID=391596 RepID=UPI000155935A|nr:RNA polymerase sigma-70 factor [Pedobacter sp. BAL39]EDM34764.1 RNA polymerase ECF-type sigma factor [Pedobacter sp. BAL39]